MMSSRRLEYVFGEATLGRAEPHLDEPDGRHAAQPWRRQRRTAAAGHCAVKLITRTRDPFERSISACEQISSSMSATSISVVGRHCKVLGISPGQIRHAEPSLSSTRWLLSCLLICIADLPYNRSEHTNPTKLTGSGQNQFQPVGTVKHWNKLCQAFEQLLRRGTNYSTIALGSALGRLLHVLTASSDHEIETAFAAAPESRRAAARRPKRHRHCLKLHHLPRSRTCSCPCTNIGSTTRWPHWRF